MKRFLGLLLALLLLAPCALAQMEGAASTVRTTDLLNAPKEDAQVLMEYYPGVRVEVLREVDSQYVQVNVGVEGGSLMGYMRKDELVFGEENVRLNRPLQVYYEQTGWTMYGYFDTRAEVLVKNSDAFLYVMGEHDDWVHAIFTSGSEDITGFVNLEDDALSEMKRRTGYASIIRTEPTGQEPTREEAIAYSKAHILEDHVMANGGDFGEVTEAMLDACEVTVEIFYAYDSADATPLYYLVQFFYTDRAWGDGLPMICAMCCLYVDGEVVAYDYGKG